MIQLEAFLGSEIIVTIPHEDSKAKVNHLERITPDMKYCEE
jgi:hypothetical protein